MRVLAVRRLALVACALAAACAWAPVTAWGNDSRVGAAGGTAFPVWAKDIRLAAETVQAVCFGSFAEYRVDFRFVNEGRKRKVKLGFPFSATTSISGENADRPVGFQAWQNGRPLTVTAAKARFRPKDSGSGFFVHTAVFPRGATTITVSYLAEPSGGAAPAAFYHYWLHTGSTWKGPIGTAVVRYRFADSFRECDAGVSPYPAERKVRVTAPRGWIQPLPRTRQWRFTDFEPMLTGTSRSEEWWKPSSPYDIVVGCVGWRGGWLAGGRWTWSSVAAPEFGEKGWDRLQDSYLSSCWAEGVVGLGEGEWVEKRFPRPVRLRELRILPGNVGYDSAFDDFARPRLMRAVFSDGSSRILRFRDAPVLHRFPVDVRTKSVRLVIESAYEGSEYPATCISEVEFGKRRAPGYAPFGRLIDDPRAVGRLPAWAGPRAPEPRHPGRAADEQERWDAESYAGGDLIGISEMGPFPGDLAPFKEPARLADVTTRNLAVRLPDESMVGTVTTVSALSRRTFEVRYSSGVDLLVNTDLKGRPRPSVAKALRRQEDYYVFTDERALPFDVMDVGGVAVGTVEPGNLVCGYCCDCEGPSDVPGQVFWRDRDRSYHLYARSQAVTVAHLTAVARSMIEPEPAVAGAGDAEPEPSSWPWWQAWLVVAAAAAVVVAAAVLMRRHTGTATVQDTHNGLRRGDGASEPGAAASRRKDVRSPILSRISRDRKLKLLERHLPPGASVLEVGAGSGWFAERLREDGLDVTTIDLTPPADYVGDINDWRKLGISPHSFDAVVALEVIEHVDCLAALRSVCRVGGLIMLSSPHPRWDWVMKVLESVHLTQKRTSGHDCLTDFAGIDMPAVVRQRPLIVHQVAIFRNEDR